MSWKRVYNSGMYRALFLIAVMVGTIAISCKSQTEMQKEEEPVAVKDDAVQATPQEEVQTPPPSEPSVEEQKQAANEPIVIKNAGFSTPESVLYDADDDIYLVSNINGSPSDKDNNGFISKVDADGKVATLKWIEGGQNNVTLNAPKGMALRGEVLYVSDIDTVRMFDRKSGASLGQIDVKGAQFLNDLAVAQNGTIYLSDSGVKATDKGLVSAGKDAVYKIDMDNKVKKLISGKALNQPNGLLPDEGGVLVVTMGGSELYRVTDEGKREPSRPVPSGGLDGLVRTRDGNLLISSWEASTIYSGTADGAFVAEWSGIKSPADIGYDAKRNRLLVPVFEENQVQIQPIPEMAAKTMTAPTATASAEGAAPAAASENAQAAAVPAGVKEANSGEAAQKGLRADAPEPEVAADKADETPDPAAAAAKNKPADASKSAEPMPSKTPITQ